MCFKYKKLKIIKMNLNKNELDELGRENL